MALKLPTKWSSADAILIRTFITSVSWNFHAVYLEAYLEANLLFICFHRLPFRLIFYSVSLFSHPAIFFPKDFLVKSGKSHWDSLGSSEWELFVLPVSWVPSTWTKWLGVKSRTISDDPHAAPAKPRCDQRKILLQLSIHRRRLSGRAIPLISFLIVFFWFPLISFPSLLVAFVHLLSSSPFIIHITFKRPKLKPKHC